MSDPYLDLPTQETLTSLAWGAIQSAVLKADCISEWTVREARAQHPVLDRPAGVFVTLHVGGELRGCLGELEPTDPLAAVVVRCARRAPVVDHRFEGVRADELCDLTFILSILSPPQPLTFTEEIQIGRHGLIVRHEKRLGVLLPDVALEHDWDVATLLKNLWIKGGIDPSVTLSEVQLWAFTAQVISSQAFAPPPY